MNISKAKAVMIVVFLFLNIFLAFQLLTPRWEGMRGAVTREEIRQMEKELQDYNYQAVVSFPRDLQSSSFLTVKSPVYEPEEIMQRFLKEETVKTNTLENKVVFETAGTILEVYHNGYYRYGLKDINGDDGSGDTEQINKQSAKEIAKDFLREREIDIEEKGNSRAEKISDGKYRFTFYQEYKKTPLFSGYVSVVLDEGLVSEVNGYQLLIVGMEERREMEVIPATVAVKRFLENTGPADRKKSITRLDLGFYSREYDAEQWEVPPVWRIIIDEEDIYYINAFTGNIEPEGIRD